jgi:hypothetical protein
MRHTKWIHVLIQIMNTLSQPRPELYDPGSSFFVVPKYESNHVIKGAKVRHGRNHLITSQ